MSSHDAVRGREAENLDGAVEAFGVRSTDGGPRDTSEDGRPGAAARVLSQWPILVFMMILWAGVWQDFAPHVLVMGALFSLLIMWVFPLPPVPFPGRFNLWYVIVFTARFLWDIVRASIQVSFVVLVRGRAARSSIVEMRLRSHDDLVITLVSHALALVPGSIVLDVDRVTATLYLHCLDVADEQRIAETKANALRVEAAIIRAIGSRADMELLARYPDSAPPFEDIAEYSQHPPHRDARAQTEGARP
ncbi:MAG: Na+/H+ antiporter subunit E [Micrococcus sp.]|nr:Na+/H+ antiporter subunit E [Micrococcus sp.]